MKRQRNDTPGTQRERPHPERGARGEIEREMVPWLKTARQLGSSGISLECRLHGRHSPLDDATLGPSCLYFFPVPIPNLADRNVGAAQEIESLQLAEPNQFENPLYADP